MKLIDDDMLLSLSDPAPLIDAIAAAFANAGKLPARLHCDLPGFDDAKLLVMPAWRDRSVIGVKVVTVMPSNRAKGLETVQGIYMLLSGDTGLPLASLGAKALTVLRTAAVSALAARYLARPDASTLLMVGTGALAPHLIRAHLAVRPYADVLVWGRNFARASALVGGLGTIAGRVKPIADLGAGLAAADVVSCATSTKEPLIRGCDVRRGTHVDLVGSFTPAMREADSVLLSGARLIVDVEEAFDESGDLVEPVKEGAISRSAPTLRDLVVRPELARRDGNEVTVFKSVGTGLADIAAAAFLFERAQGSR
ncbi:ornithine cyclodeaminase family protein [Sphingopyxis sp. JAI128]|uniref:ornithine cyclodeaminase family protein n=1 Tax=Sphingopyxis sp. JAI128 TaxID=2723066 RepID=UPI00160DD59F|nr:ornithine cyclodeaminase family protein [Sphingopyxis sp. JAI128]MBB6428158.1 ornithine cyclodeaminase [Sphingopyxis sp. JAI128]